MDLKPARTAARTARVHPIDAFIEKIVNAQPDPPRTVPIFPLFLLVIRHTWWRFALCIFPIWGIFAFLEMILREQQINVDQILGLILITLWLLFFLWKPWQLLHQMWMVTRTGQHATATVLRLVEGNARKRSTADVPPDQVLAEMRVITPRLGAFMQRITVSGALTAVTVPGARLDVLINPQGPDIWAVLSELAPAASEGIVPVFSSRVVPDLPLTEDTIIVPPARPDWDWTPILLASGLIFLLMTGHFWLRGQDAIADSTHYRTAPLCTPGITKACREERPATILSTRSRASSSRRAGDSWVTLRCSDGQIQEIFDIGPDFNCCDPATIVAYNLDLFATLQPGMQVQAEYWGGNLTLVHDSQGKLLIAEGFPPYQVGEIRREMYILAMLSGVCLLIGLTMVWALYKA